MHPARFVTFLFAYAGVLLVIQAGYSYNWQLSLESVLVASTGLIIFANAPARMRKPIEEQTPSEYGPFVYVFVALCLVLTILTIGTIWLVIA